MSRSPSNLINAAQIWKRTKPIDWMKHTMCATALESYLKLKVHHLVDLRDWSKIIVIGEYDRECCISEREKNDKLFNWHRPTAEVVGDDLFIKCYPGRDYVYHYALI